MIHHHIKYKEIHGVDEVVILTQSQHRKLHARLRAEGKCNIPSWLLGKYSHRAYSRRVLKSHPESLSVVWKKFAGFERYDKTGSYKSRLLDCVIVG
jgi:hypothetical protein